MTSRSTKGAPPDGLRYASTPGRWVITTTVLGSGVAALDATVVGIALPAIGRDLRVDVAGLQWVVTGYALTLAGLLLVGGALGDRYGRRRIAEERTREDMGQRVVHFKVIGKDAERLRAYYSTLFGWEIDSDKS